MFNFVRYGVDNKKVSIPVEKKMHKEWEMTKQNAKNLAHEQYCYEVSFCNKNIFVILIYIADMAI